MKLCAVSVDLDQIGCYYKIHGLGPPPEELAHIIYERGLARAARLFASRGIPVTWFVVGRDAEHAGNADRLRAVASHGDELGNHSYSHFYELARKAPRDVDDEIARCDGVLRALSPRVRGFRAPGYDVSPVMFDVLARLGYRYDSSVFPSVAYYGAKAMVMGAMRVTGRESGSVLGNPRALLAPRRPYRPASGSPYRAGGHGILELPIAVTGGVRLPVIGTSLILAPAWLRARMVTAALREQLFNLELHGIDLCDAAVDDIPATLVARQPDLRRPLAHKLAAFDETLSFARAAGARFVTLADAATLL